MDGTKCGEIIDAYCVFLSVDQYTFVNCHAEWMFSGIWILIWNVGAAFLELTVHKCVNWVSIGSGNGLPSVRSQAIT